MAETRQSERIKPPALRKGDTVGIVAPASYFQRQDFESGCEALRQIGYNPVFDDSIFDRDLYFAGSVERRARELEEMFVRPDVKAILCARGGYGSNYLLPSLDVTKIAAHPKILVGYSDLTSLLTYLCDVAGIVTFHGPMVAKDFAKSGGVDAASWQAALGGSGNWWPENWMESAESSLARCWVASKPQIRAIRWKKWSCEWSATWVSPLPMACAPGMSRKETLLSR